MNLADARDAVYLRTGYDSSDGQLTPERITSCLRAALNFITSEHDWDWLQTTETLSTVAGTASVTPLVGSSAGVTWIRTLNLINSNADYIEKTPWSEFRMFLNTVTGEPTKWCDYGGQLCIWPTPDGVYTITHDFIRGENALNSDTDTPLLPTQFEDAWIAKATAMALRRVAESIRAQEQEADYQAWQHVMVDNRHRSKGGKRVAVRPGGWI